MLLHCFLEVKYVFCFAVYDDMTLFNWPCHYRIGQVIMWWRGGAAVRHLGLRSVGRGFKSCSRQRYVTTLGKLFTPTAGGQKWVITLSIAQAVECCVAYFHANNYKYSNKLLPQISQYFVIYFSLITMQRIYPGKDSYSCQIQVECSSRQHSNTHAIR